MRSTMVRWKTSRFLEVTVGLLVVAALLAVAGTRGDTPSCEATAADGPAVAVTAHAGSTMAGRGASAGRAWRIKGDLSEACTCGVPCTCNFGGAPSPNHFCYAIFSLDIKNGHYGDVKLGGLHLAGGNAAKGSVWYIDDKATPDQVAALRVIGTQINTKLVGYWKGVDPKIVEDPQFTLLGFKTTKITQRASKKGNLLEIGEFGSFDSDYLLGIDGKTPIVVENNWSWFISHGIKGKTRQLKYQDEYGNTIDTSETNSNQGKFDWSDRTPIYLR